MEINKYDWINFYKEFAKTLLTYKDKRAELIKKVNAIYSQTGIDMPLLEEDYNIIDIDPFTVFGIFNKQITDENRITIIKTLASLFDIKSAIPTRFDSIPVLMNLNASFFTLKHERGVSDIDNLWLLYEAAIAYANDPNENNKKMFSKYFDIVMTLKRIATGKLTMALYWLNSDVYLNLDSRNVWYIWDTWKLPNSVISSIKKVNYKITAEEYFKVIEKIREYINSEESSFKNFNDLSDAAWRSAKNIDSKNWYPLDYSPSLSVSDWLKLLNDNTVFNENSLEIMARFKDFGPATCSQLAVKYGEKKNFYNAGSASLGKRVYKKTNCPLYERETGENAFWPVLYIGKEAPKGDNGVFIYKLRDELSEALDSFDLSHVKLYSNDSPMEEDVITETKPTYNKEKFLEEVFMSETQYDKLVAVLKNKKNIILQGAPGVGKTFAAKRLAYSVMEEIAEDRIEFIQFHQNYSYEDFMMGYKPVGEGFELKHGIFYNFCAKARGASDKDFFFIIDEINRGNMSKIFGELLMLIENDYRGTEATLSYNGHSFSVPENLYIIGMMNTADRSLAMIDYALRRRFSFFTITPGFETAGFIKYKDSLDNKNFNKLIDKVCDLNRAILNDKSLGSGFCIGHSYFCNMKECSTLDLANIIEFDILPMLSEYWFDDEDKLILWEKELSGVIDEQE